MNRAEPAPSKRLRIGIDVGGTFTDFVVADGEAGRLFVHKEPSTPDDPSRAVLEGLVSILERETLKASDVGGLMHGTTIGLNAIIQRRGAKIGLVVSTGFRDVLEIARCRMPSSFDLHADKETPIVPRSRIVEIDARFDAGGGKTSWPDEAELDRVTAAVSALEVDAVALMTLNGYANAAAEAELAQELSERLGGMSVTSAAAIWPEIREYERTLVAGLNAYIQPLMKRYFDRLSSGLDAIGIETPLLVTASNGGCLSAGSAIARPVETILSGPASGVMAATRQAREIGIDDLITFDMGGTSSDMAVTVGGSAAMATRTDIGGLPLILPAVDVNAIGAGGGSIVWLDDHGILKVGPHSAGAEPGPVCYGLGGTEPTVTDCYVALGYVSADGFGGGEISLDVEAAVAALAAIGRRLGLDGDTPDDLAARVAEGALSVASAGMAGSLFRTMAQRGLDPRRFVLLPFGGAGPTHAALLAEETGIERILVPSSAGAFCALGAVNADLRRDYVCSLRMVLNETAAERILADLQEMRRHGNEWIDSELPQIAERRGEPAADMRYGGQAYELRVPLSADFLEEREQNRPTPAEAAVRLAEMFHVEHERVYGFRDPTATLEVGTVRLGVIGLSTDVGGASAADGSGEPSGNRPIFHRSRWHDAQVYRRADLAVGVLIHGPAVVDLPDTTVVIAPGWTGRVDPSGNLLMERASS